MNVHRTMPPPPQIAPRLVIIEQPKQRGMRFRYLCEGRSAGSIPGENTTAERKTWPSVQIQNYHGEVTIRVSLVSNEKIPRPHPHSLVGKDCSDGICTVRVSPETQMTATFSNLGVQCVKRKEVTEALRTRQRLQVDPFNSAQSNQQTTDIDLNVVLLCFEAFINQGDYHYVIQPVLSNPIYDKKATGSALLRICRVDRSFGSCKGGDEVYLLCDKVQKDDITICFYDAETGWEAYGEFSPTDVHRQVAIVFRTPAYKDQNILQATTVQFQLRRGSDHETSDPKEFTYLPSHHAQPSLLRGPKRKIVQTAKTQLNKRIREKVGFANPTGAEHYSMFPPPMSMYPVGMPQQLPFPMSGDFRASFHSGPIGLRPQPSPSSINHSQAQQSLGPSRLLQVRDSTMPNVPHDEWRITNMSQSSMSPQQTFTPLQNFQSPTPMLEIPVSSYQPSVPSQNPAALEGYEEPTDSIASFKGIDTDGIDLNESIKHLSLEPIDGPTVKTEPDPPMYFPTHSNAEEVHPVLSPMGYNTNFNVVAPSPESYHVQSPSYSQQMTPAPIQQHGPYGSSNNLDSLNVDQTERLPSYDLEQNLPSDALDDILGARHGAN